MTNGESDFYKRVGRNMKLLREGNKMTQKELAKIIELSKNHISDLENGRKTISCAVLYDYANAFDVPADSILGRGEQKILPELGALISGKLDEGQQRMLKRLLNTYLDRTS